jgi:hypothetical protein
VRIEDQIANVAGGLVPSHTQNGVSQNAPTCKNITTKKIIVKLTEENNFVE